MNDKNLHGLDDLLDADIPQVDASSKAQAIKLAGSEFSNHFKSEVDQEVKKENEENFQGNSESARRIDNRSTTDTKKGWLSVLINSIRSFFMNTNNNPMAYKGFVAASVAFIAVSVIFITPQFKDPTSLPTAVTEPADRTPNAEIQSIEEVVVAAQSTRQEGNLAKPNEVARNSTPSEAESADELLTDGGVELDLSGASNPITTNKQELKGQLEEKTVSSKGPQLASLDQEGQTSDISSAPVAKKIPNGGGLKLELGEVRTRTVVPAPSDVTISPPARPDAGEQYAEYQSNPIKLVAEEPVSTFSIDVDTASYALVRNQLNNGLLPKPQAVRIEEFVNYFDYDYPLPSSKTEPFKPTINVVESPWNAERKLVHIGIKGYDIDTAEQPDSNLVFLLDVSGSMSSANKLPLVKQSINLLLDTLKPNDTVSIVVYAGAAGTVLEPTKVSDKQKILDSLHRLNAGGSTAGGAGIELAYQLAEQNFDKDSVNRIILATDGDFNVGQSSNEDLKTLVERKRESGVFLSILGFGRHNYQDDMMQTLAQNGNGVAAYIDSLSEAKKVLVDEATSTLFPIAKDVKIQVEFNPATVSEYRLVGYETRALKREDFNNDKVDAGDIGAGHSVTAIYEITPADATNKSIDTPRYSLNKPETVQSDANEYGFVKVRYKLPDSDTSKLIQTAIGTASSKPNSDVEFSIAVAGFAQLLNGNQNTGDLNYAKVISQAEKHKGDDPFGYRSEFIQLVRMAEIAKP